MLAPFPSWSFWDASEDFNFIYLFVLRRSSLGQHLLCPLLAIDLVSLFSFSDNVPAATYLGIVALLLQIGQMASTRADFLPPQYYERVKTLQSDTPTESTAYIKYELSVYYVLPC